MSSAHNSISARAQEHTCTLDRRHSQHTMPHSSTPQRNWALHLTGHVNSGFYSRAALLKQSKHRLAHTATNTTLYTTSRCAHHTPLKSPKSVRKCDSWLPRCMCLLFNANKGIIAGCSSGARCKVFTQCNMRWQQRWQPAEAPQQQQTQLQVANSERTASTLRHSGHAEQGRRLLFGFVITPQMLRFTSSYTRLSMLLCLFPRAKEQ